MSLYGLAVIPIRYLVAAAATGLALSPGTADASLLIDRWTSRESLKVDSAGRAQITWWVGGRKRTVVLPPALAALKPAGAALDDGALVVRFA